MLSLVALYWVLFRNNRTGTISMDSVSSMSSVVNILVGASSLPRYPPPYPIDKNTLEYASLPDGPQFAIIHNRETLVMKVGSEDQQAVYAG